MSNAVLLATSRSLPQEHSRTLEKCHIWRSLKHKSNSKPEKEIVWEHNEMPAGIR
jgi:hypothetical protein